MKLRINTIFAYQNAYKHQMHGVVHIYYLGYKMFYQNKTRNCLKLDWKGNRGNITDHWRPFLASGSSCFIKALVTLWNAYCTVLLFYSKEISHCWLWNDSHDSQHRTSKSNYQTNAHIHTHFMIVLALGFCNLYFKQHRIDICLSLIWRHTLVH